MIYVTFGVSNENILVLLIMMYQEKISIAFLNGYPSMDIVKYCVLRSRESL